MATKDKREVGEPALVGRYELLQRVVSGALGELWQARIASGPEEGRAVHVRRIPRVAGLEKRDVERLTNAGFAAMELRHPKIAAVLDVVVAPTEIAIVSEHIAGWVLQSLVRPEPGIRVTVPAGVAVRVALDLLEALDAVREPWAALFAEESEDDASARASLHGGLLPDGLLVASFGETMLLEAGLAGVALTIPAIADQPDVVGYRAPEQLEKDRTSDERTDVFTIGILVWEMISGRSLFGPQALPRPPAPPSPSKTHGDPIAVSGARRRVLSHPIARLDASPLSKGKVPKELADWVARCLERDPARRFPSARDAIRALSSFGASSLSGHEAVVGFVRSLGVAEPTVPDTERSASPSSKRPTAPPVNESASSPGSVAHEGVTRPGHAVRRAITEEPDTEESPDSATRDFGEKAVAQAAAMLEIPDSIPPSTDVESLPPSEPSAFEGFGAPLVTDVTAGAPNAEAVTLPPLTALEANRLEIVGAEGSITLVSGGAPDDALRARDVFAASAVVAIPGADAVRGAVAAGDVITSAPVVWPLGEAPVAAAKGRDAEDTALSERRTRSRKLVIGIMAGAAVLAIIAVLRAAFPAPPHDDAAVVHAGAAAPAPTVQTSAPTTAAVALVAPSSPPSAAPTSVAAPAAEPRAQGAAAPASVPAVVATGEPPQNQVRRGPAKRAAYRPSGI